MNAAQWIWVAGIIASSRDFPAAAAVFNSVDEGTAILDAALFRRIAAGESAALGEFYDLHSGQMFALAFRILNDPKDAEDVLQEAFLQIWSKAATCDATQGRALGWALALTRNKAIDRLRATHRRARAVEEAAERAAGESDGFGSSTGPSAPGRDEGEITRAALARLPQEQRQAIEMAFFGGLTQTEIAIALNEPLGTIKARIRRGMLKLREELEPSLREQPPSPPMVAAP